MKILFDHHLPFMLAHGGFQTQIEQTKAALQNSGVEVENLCWWSDRQGGDVIHFFGAPPTKYQTFAVRKGLPIVNTVLLSETCNRSTPKILAQGVVTRFILGLPFGRSIKDQLSWRSFLSSECIIVGLEAEKRILRVVYGVPEKRIRVVPLGCEQAFFSEPRSSATGKYLISVGTVSKQKRTVELANLAIAANVPILFVGKPYDAGDPYWKQFRRLIDGKVILYQDHVFDRQEMIRLYRGAKGFVLFSTFENWSLVADEAAACGLPLLVPDQPWSRERFQERASYFSSKRAPENIRVLKQFYAESSNLALPPKPKTWEDVALRLIDIYAGIASTSR